VDKVARSVLLIDDQGHSGLAVSCLRAIDPQWFCIVDEDSVGGDRRSRSVDGHETGEDACDVRVHGDRLAGVVEGRLCDGVVLWHELKLDHVSNCRGDVVGRVDIGAIGVANGDDMDIYLI
jgi:hypothetical protein